MPYTQNKASWMATRRTRARSAGSHSVRTVRSWAADAMKPARGPKYKTSRAGSKKTRPGCRAMPKAGRYRRRASARASRHTSRLTGTGAGEVHEPDQPRRGGDEGEDEDTGGGSSDPQRMGTARGPGRLRAHILQRSSAGRREKRCWGGGGLVISWNPSSLEKDERDSQRSALGHQAVRCRRPSTRLVTCPPRRELTMPLLVHRRRVGGEKKSNFSLAALRYLKNSSGPLSEDKVTRRHTYTP